jgi:hypothetical protein
LDDVAAERSWSDRRWLIAGQRASASEVRKARAEGFAVAGFGVEAAAGACDLIIAADLKAVLAAAPAISASQAVVALPARPHVAGWAGDRTLQSLADDSEPLRTLAAAGRLAEFRLWTGADADDRIEVLRPDFTGEALPLFVLAELGVRFLRHLGMRSDKTIAGMEAGHRPGERHAGELATIRRTYDLSYGPYGYPTPARIFVGSDDEQMLGVRVLDYSIQKWSSMDAVVEPLDFRAVPVPREEKNRSKTGFSFCRFDIPRLTGFSGRGLYVDADMQVFQDITDLWTLPLDEADVLYALSSPSQGRTPQTSVMLLNCQALDWDVRRIVQGLDDGDYSYKELMSGLCIVPEERVQPGLPYWWNSLELHEPGRTCLIHYTDMHRQPWISANNPNGGLWYADCAEAIAAGFVDMEEINTAIRLGHVSPQLPHWLGLGLGLDDTDAAQAASHWIAPYHRFLSPKAPEGEVTLTGPDLVSGWAWDPARPDEAIEVEIEVDGQIAGSIICDVFSEQLARYGKGDGRHCFEYRLPPATVGGDRMIELRIAGASIVLRGCPLTAPGGEPSQDAAPAELVSVRREGVSA